MRQGFTLLEIIVVLGIMVILTGIALSYNHASQTEVALSVEEAKISQFILLAKSLSIATYGSSGSGPGLVCGYGMYFNAAAQTYGIFQFEPAQDQGITACRDVPNPVGSITAAEIKPYTAGTWNVHVANGVILQSGGASVILFFPPTPKIYVSADSSNSNWGFSQPTPTGYVHLKAGNGDTRTISVNPMGQVSL
ncbi:MAG: type II secretion system protein [Patescibacteria group bacterium]|nr:type II secretion system protein [Patescibacteria group bacterium]